MHPHDPTSHQVLAIVLGERPAEPVLARPNASKDHIERPRQNAKELIEGVGHEIALSDHGADKSLGHGLSLAKQGVPGEAIQGILVGVGARIPIEAERDGLGQQAAIERGVVVLERGAGHLIPILSVPPPSGPRTA